MLKKEIFLSNGESDGYEIETCDRCENEAYTQYWKEQYVCEECLRKELNDLENKHGKLLSDIQQLENQIDELEKMMK